jgi:hypothetical protein
MGMSATTRRYRVTVLTTLSSGRTLTTCRGAGGCVSVFKEAVSLSARWLMRAFMLAGAPTVDSKAKRLDSIPLRQD